MKYNLDKKAEFKVEMGKERKSKIFFKSYSFGDNIIFFIPGRYGSSYLLCGSDSSILIEAGSAGDMELYKNVLKVSGKNLRGIICTHEHFDHILGLKTASQHFSVPVFTGSRTAAVLNGERKNSIPPFWSMRMLPLTWFFQGRPLPAAPDLNEIHRLINPFLNRKKIEGIEILKDGENLSKLGFEGWEVLILAGHSPEDLCLYNRKYQVLISGDVILSYRGGEFNAMMNNQTSYKLAVERLASLPVSVIFPGHGEPILGESEFLLSYISSVDESGFFNKPKKLERNAL